MHYPSLYGLKKAIGVVVLSCFIAGGVSAMTAPTVINSSKTAAVSVNRANKGDRLRQAMLPHQLPNDVSSTLLLRAPSKRSPLGCDPIFSPVVEPALANIFRRCMA
jgi:hypothetical protein